jgi:hypothetical protein
MDRASSLFGYGLKGRIGVVARPNRPTLGVLTCRRPAVALALFFHLGSSDPDVGKESACR